LKDSREIKGKNEIKVAGIISRGHTFVMNGYVTACKPFFEAYSPHIFDKKSKII
jgi:hypothetical protein